MTTSRSSSSRDTVALHRAGGCCLRLCLGVVTPRSRILAFGSAAVLVVVGAICLAVVAGLTDCRYCWASTLSTRVPKHVPNRPDLRRSQTHGQHLRGHTSK